MFICPVCGEKLIESQHCYSCANAHLFDKAKKGYVNLLLGRDGSLHGDSKEMALARYEIMEAGFYAPLKDAVVRALGQTLQNPAVIADCGCGECYYTSAVQAAFPQAQVLATDISKEALGVAKRRGGTLQKAVASSFSLPIASESCDAALNLFSPFVREEYARILKPGGILLMVIPLEDHLWELKKAVYETPYKNEPKQAERVDYRKRLQQPWICELFAMTPYAIKSSPEDSQKLSALTELEVTFSFRIFIYKKGE